MRQKRAKAYKKQMNVYHYTFKFREPYQIIVDDEIVTTCQKSSFDIHKGLTRTIQAENKPMITQCCMQALYDTKNQESINLAKTFERRKCNHREAIDPSQCIESIVNIKGQNKHRYIVASQDLQLRKKLRKIPGVPLIYMNRSVMVMEPISDVSNQYNMNYESKKLTGGLNDIEAGKLEKQNEGEDGDGDELEVKKKKRKGPKEPNPLSVKKKKTDNATAASTNQEQKKKPNRRKRHGKSKAEEKEDQEQEQVNEATTNEDAQEAITATE